MDYSVTIVLKKKTKQNGILIQSSIRVQIPLVDCIDEDSEMSAGCWQDLSIISTQNMVNKLMETILNILTYWPLSDSKNSKVHLILS